MLTFIGEIITPYKNVEDCPQNINKNGPVCTLLLYKEYQAGLKCLQKGDKILILYWLGLSKDAPMEQVSRHDGSVKGVFALRSPHRPNPIGVAIVTIESIIENAIEVIGLDCVNGTKLLDIKPAVMDEK